MTSAAELQLISRKQAIAYLLPAHCGQCAELLPEPGLPCQGCGTIPPVTAPEAAEHLDSATAIAGVQAKVAEAEAEALHAHAVAKWQEAARVFQLGQLTDARDAARRALEEHDRGHKVLAALLSDAGAEEEAKAAELAPQAKAVKRLERAVTRARRMRAGVEDIGRAVAVHAAAGAELRPYQAALEKAAADHAAAERRVGASGARGDQLKAALAQAQRNLEHPPPALMGKAAVEASPFLLLARGQLDHDPAALEIAAETGRAICDLTGATAEIAAEARAELRAEQEAAARARPLMVGFGPDGLPTAVPNPLNSGTPRPYHPAQHPAHPVQPSITPGWPL